MCWITDGCGAGEAGMAGEHRFPSPQNAVDPGNISLQAASSYLKIDASLARPLVPRRLLCRLFRGSQIPAAVQLYAPGDGDPDVVKVQHDAGLKVTQRIREQMQEYLQRTAGEAPGDSCIMQIVRLPGVPAALGVRLLSICNITAEMLREANVHASRQWMHRREHGVFASCRAGKRRRQTDEADGSPPQQQALQPASLSAQSSPIRGVC